VKDIYSKTIQYVRHIYDAEIGKTRVSSPLFKILGDVRMIRIQYNFMFGNPILD